MYWLSIDNSLIGINRVLVADRYFVHLNQPFYWLPLVPNLPGLTLKESTWRRDRVPTNLAELDVREKYLKIIKPELHNKMSAGQKG
jgi:hypothetical protein